MEATTNPGLIDQNLLILGAAILLVLLIGGWLLARARRSARRRAYRPDVLDEGVAPAARNQALIDAPSAATAALAASGPDVLAGLGEAVAVGAAEAASGDDLARIKGVGPKLVSLLGTLGVTRFEQIAAWTDEDLARIDAQLGAFAGRPARDAWVDQARLLAAGDTAGYEAKFGKL